MHKSRNRKFNYSGIICTLFFVTIVNSAKTVDSHSSVYSVPSKSLHAGTTIYLPIVYKQASTTNTRLYFPLAFNQPQPSDKTLYLPIVSKKASPQRFRKFFPLVPNHAQPTGYTYYLPVVNSDTPHTRTTLNFPGVFNYLPRSIFGLESSWIDASVLDNTINLNANWLRNFSFSWKDIEPEFTEPRTYLWEQVNEPALQAISNRNINLIAIVKFTPDWAQKLPGVSCGPVARDNFDEFADFMGAVVERYGGPPYNIKYWELGNEPDIDPDLVAPDNIFGCWGDAQDKYYGGGYYAEMLKHVYPAVKAVDPEAKILIGGLALDCDPTNPQPGKVCQPGKFFEGILQFEDGTGGSYFDIVSFHGYATYIGSLAEDENNPKWKRRGGVVLGKINFLREVMSQYNFDKPLFLTEGGLMCPDYISEYCNPPGEEFFEAQADYVVWFFIRNWADGLLGTAWYQLNGPGWRDLGLLDGKQNPKPVYHAYKFMTQILDHATFVQRREDYPGLLVYEFTKPEKQIWVLWAPDESPHNISLPNEVLNVFDKYGNHITPKSNQITVKSPIYIELEN